jgi:photosystem II stability/assembly factor-like uncharacterized protein
MKRKKHFSLGLFYFCLVIFCNKITVAQTNIFNLPKNIEQPSWYKNSDWKNPNVFIIDSLINIYKHAEGSKKIKEENSDYEEEADFEEDPYITAYIRWRKNLLPFISKEGTIVIDSNYYFNKFQQQQNKLSTNNLGNWVPIGPTDTYRSGVGDKTNTQSNITAFAISASNPNIVFAGAETGALFKSSNKGLNWSCINNDIASTAAISAIGVDPTNANKILFYNNDGLFLSINGGVSFSRLNAYTFGEINRIVINQSNGRFVVASINGVYFSNDNGNTWLLSSGTSSAGNLFDLVQKPGNTNVLFAIGAQVNTNNLLLYTSTDGGLNFSITYLRNGTSNIISDGARLAVTPANANYIYCVGLQSNAGPVILKSINGGSTFTVTAVSTTQSFGGDNTSTGLGMSSGQGYYDLDIAASPLNANHLIVGTTSTYKSTDGGVNFSPIGGYVGSFDYKIHPDLQMIQTNGSDTYLASDGGVVYSNDFFSSNATVLNNGLTASFFWGFGQGWDQDIVVGGRYHNGDAVLNSAYGTGNSIYLGGGEDATGHVFHGKENEIGFRDLGSFVVPPSLIENITSSEFTNTKWPQDDYYGYFASKLMIDPRYSFIYYLGEGNTLWKSFNSGAGYSSLKDFGSKVWRFDISRSNPNVIYVCTQGNGLQKTIDGGNTWSALSLPAGVTYEYYQSDIAISFTNSDEVILCMKSAAAANKVFKSTDGGARWTNITGSALYNKEVSYILYHGNNGSMYAITQSVPCEIFFKDNSMSDWTLFTNGLPKNIQIWGGSGIFFRDNKLRIATTRGIWESKLVSDVIPVAQPMADKKYVNCSSDTVQFTDYSILNYNHANWHWSFPGASYVSNPDVKNPKVVYANPGNYNVSLLVTDSLENTNYKTISNMISFTNDNCKADSVAGKSLVFKGTNTPVSLGKAPINSNSFSLSCWIKPNGKQNSFAQLIAHDPYPGSSYGFGLGFSFLGYTPNLNLCYTDNIVGYSNSSSLIADSLKWNFVVLTYAPSGVYIYLNGVKQLVRNGSMPAIDLSQTPFYINRDIHNQGGYYNGEIDEIKIYNYTLSETEVREKMHLIPTNPILENGLIKYCQFNYIDSTSLTAYELINKIRLSLPDTSYINKQSEVPVGPGKVFTFSNINSGGMKDFTGLGLKLFFKPFATGITYPNGNLVGFRLNVPPYTKPDSRTLEPDSSWFIIDNYGTNKTFSNLDSIRFEELDVTPGSYTRGNFKLFKRLSNADKNSWGTELDSSDIFIYNPVTKKSSITYSVNNNINSFGQFTLVCNMISNYIFNGNGNWSDASNWNNNMIPPNVIDKGQIIIDPIIGGECVLDAQQTINQGGSIKVMPGKKFRVPQNLLIL